MQKRKAGRGLPALPERSREKQNGRESVVENLIPVEGREAIGVEGDFGDGGDAEGGRDVDVEEGIGGAGGIIGDESPIPIAGGPEDAGFFGEFAPDANVFAGDGIVGGEGDEEAAAILVAAPGTLQKLWLRNWAMKGM